MSDQAQDRERMPPYTTWSSFRDDVWSWLRHRSPRPLSEEFLRDERNCGAGSTCRKHFSTLVFLGIIDEDGNPHEETWSRLTLKDPATYQRHVRELVENAYGELIQACPDWPDLSDPLLEDKIFEVYGLAVTSRPQARRFLQGICAEAGIIVGAEVEGEGEEERS